MKNTLLKGLVTITILSSISVMSQEIPDNEILNTSINVSSFDLTSKELVGNSYLQKEFLPAKAIGKNKTYATRYNAYQDEMEVKKDGKDYTLPKTFDYYIEFTASSKIYRVYKYELDNKSKLGFFVELFKGNNIILLLKERIILQDEIKPKTGYDKYEPPTLKHIKDKLYVGYKDNTTLELPSKKKAFYSLFLTKGDEVAKYAKSKRLGIKDPEDVIEIFKYYNSLK